ncbi:hypothetical protein [Novosphingobium soli]|uniref:Uncharacterized protein n=1 Tax=Novosphingobium soli TaxID=574956 RepID=A0ABV6CYU3_9SPHN
MPDLPPAPPAIEAPAFDLARLPRGPGLDLRAVKARCPEGRAGEIVVCAPDESRERMQLSREAERPDPRPPRAEMDLGGGARLDVHLDSAAMPNGQSAQRIMVAIKLPF